MKLMLRILFLGWFILLSHQAFGGEHFRLAPLNAFLFDEIKIDDAE